MDLVALWRYERERIASELHSSTDCRKSLSSHSSEDVGRSKPKSKSKSSTAAGSKKKTSTPCSTSCVLAKDRDRVFQLLLESSVAPFPKDAMPNFGGVNEFAIEYADRAARRFWGAPQQPQQQAVNNVAVPIASPSAVSPAPRGQTSRHSSTQVSSSHGQMSTPAQVAPSSVQPTAAFPAMTKTAQILRKNGRKRAGTEFSSQALKPYVGDMFGTRGDYVDGMLYMSRMKRSYQVLYSGADQRRNHDASFSGPPWGDLAKPEGRSVLKDGVSDAFAVANGGNNNAKLTGPRTNSTVVLSTAEDDDQQESTLTNLQRKQQQRCSLTLSNWSFNPENARLMVQENVVEALIRLCKDGDTTTTLHCVTALMNLSHLPELRRVIVQQGAVTTVAEVVNDMEDKTIRTACAITLCNLCSLQGEEGLLVEDGAVSALSTLINEHEKVSRICRSALFNLTCVSQSYHKIESVLKAFMALTTTKSGGGNNSSYPGRAEEEYNDITAKALCNLSNLKRIRLRLMEEGIVGAIASLLHPNSSMIQELLAHILLNLSKLPACRSEMVTKGCMATLGALAVASADLSTKCLIASTLWNLSKDSANAVRMVSEGLLLLMSALYQDIRDVGARGEDDIDDPAKQESLLQVCARALYNVSCCEDSRAKFVERDAVNILSLLSRRSAGEDAKQMCTLALCNLMSVQKAAADIVTAGAITALIELSMAPGQACETRNLFSKALHGLCDKAATRGAVADAGVIPALLFLSSAGGSGSEEDMNSEPGRCQSPGVLSEIRARCTAAFACLAADPHTAPHVCNAAVVKCVTRILVLEHANVMIERFCCSCLSLLCRDEQCSLIMVEVGAIEMVLATCVDSHDMESKASCCHVLASVSCHPSCCNALVQMGVISVLATLAKLKEDAVIQSCCAITLANLSVEPVIRETLASAGTVGIVSVLSNSYSEDSQRDCAKVLCNLSCIRGNEAALVKEGAVGVLMMISMVRAVSVSTKETCIRALLNLLNAETMKQMVGEGLVKILPAISGLDSMPIAALVTHIFSKLLNHPVGRNALCAERPSLSALLHLMEYDLLTESSEERKLASLHEELLSELVYYENSRLLSVRAGILDALHRISRYEESFLDSVDYCAEKKLALVFFTLAKSEDSRMAVTSSSSLETLLKFLRLHSPKENCSTTECALYAAATLSWLGWHDSTHKFLEKSEIPIAITQMLQVQAQKNDGDEFQAYSPQTIKACVLVLCCLTHNSELLDVMLKGNVVAHLNGILATEARANNEHECLLSRDAEFIALVCVLLRQLSHATYFSSAVADQPAPIFELFCILVESVIETNDVESSLDCADVLCSIVFTHTLDQEAADTRPVRRGSIVQAEKPSHQLVDTKVLTAIGLLMTEKQLPETRWRSAASLWALASVPEYRRELVAWGVTPMLVRESYRAAQTSSMNTLQCCAGALCSLTMVSEETNAANMVDEGAMPALIQLAKLENETIREYCTLALSNLSGPSPTVESGAVSALLNLSLDFAAAPGTRSGNSSPSRRESQQHAVLTRPPLVTGERHKLFAVLPEFAIEISCDRFLDEQKREAELAASAPPHPQLPAIAFDLLVSSASNSERSEGKPPKDISAAETTVEPVSTRDQEFLEARFFGKVDPEESLALMTDTEGSESDEDPSRGEPEQVVNQEQDSATAKSVPESRSWSSKSGPGGDSRADGNSLPKVVTSGNNGSSTGPNYVLSPLSRVVSRKKHTVQAVQKFKDAAARKSQKESSGKMGMAGFQSSPSLTKNPSGTIAERSDSVGGQPPVNLHQFKSPGLPRSVSTSILPPATASENESAIDARAIDARAALLAAVSAAGLYGAAPPKHDDHHAARTAKLSKKSQLKAKKKEIDRSSDQTTGTPIAEPKSTATLTETTSIEEIQMQAKRLGLWS